MTRTLLPVAAFLLAGVALSAPAPEPFVSGWGSPLDPDRDCKIRRDNGILTIEMPGTYHDYDPVRKPVNAPRLFREFEGDFVIQVRVRIACRPSQESTVVDQHSFVAAGFLLIQPDHWLRLEYRAAGPSIRAGGSVFEIHRGVGGGGMSRIWDKRGLDWPFQSEPDYVYLRLERWGDILSHSISPDGTSWVPAGGLNTLGLPSKLKVCLASYTTSKDPSKIIFDRLWMTQGKKREPWDFVSDWNDPVNPDKDCKIQRDKEALTIEMPGRDHDYDPVRKRFNAPRLLCELEGDFDLVVRVRIDYRPSAQSTVTGQPSFVSAGFLVIYPEENESICDRMEYAVSQQGSRRDAYAVAPFLAMLRRYAPAPEGTEADSYALMKTWLCKMRKGNGIEWNRGMPKLHVNSIWERGWQNWPLPEKADCAYLRLEQRGEWICFFISPDGKKWTPLRHWGRRPPIRIVGLAAYSTSTEPSKVRFDQLKLARGKKESK